MFPVTTVHFAFPIVEILSDYDSTTVVAPPRQEAGMYVFVKPYDQNDPWFWGVLTQEIDPERGVWTYERIERSDILKHIEKEIREQDFVSLPDIDEFLPRNLLAGAPA